ncbi:hypothetical protein ACJX0J_039637, partial [Zea mays]
NYNCGGRWIDYAKEQGRFSNLRGGDLIHLKNNHSDFINSESTAEDVLAEVPMVFIWALVWIAFTTTLDEAQCDSTSRNSNIINFNKLLFVLMHIGGLVKFL